MKPREWDFIIGVEENRLTMSLSDQSASFMLPFVGNLELPRIMPKNESKPKLPSKDWTISVVSGSDSLIVSKKGAIVPRGSFPIMPQADSKGNVIFANTEEVTKSKFESGFSNCVALAKTMLEKVSEIGSNLEVDSITLKLSVNAKYGCSLLADAKVAGAIELKIKRK